MEVAPVSLSLSTFLTIPACPPGWRDFDLYILRNEASAFYVGQSYCAFERVWEHIRSGPHGHSIVGRFVLANWPRSGSFIVELHSSRGPRFAECGQDLNAAERQLIEELRPCFNVSLNEQPLPLPPGLRPANAPIKYMRSYRRMLREAGYAARRAMDPGEWDEGD